MSPAELSALVEKRLDRELRPGRARHSRSVASLAAELCSRNGLDPEAGFAAGLGHDLCKEMAVARQRELAAIYGRFSGRSFDRDNGIGAATIHGPAAAGLFVAQYAFEGRDVLEAIALHSLGERDMGDLARIVYAADKLEPGRGHVDPAFRSFCLGLSPGELFQAVLAETIGWLRKAGQPVAPESLELCDPAILRELGS